MRQSSTVSGEARNAPGALQVLKAAAAQAQKWKNVAPGGVPSKLIASQLPVRLSLGAYSASCLYWSSLVML